jgi:hypothetical protein
VKKCEAIQKQFISKSRLEKYKSLKEIISPPAYKIEAILTQTSGETEIY